jgi:hypothetical protein
MEEPSSPSNAYQAEQYQLAAGEDTQFQRKFLTEEEERELATTSNRQERRRIQNRVAQRAYRKSQFIIDRTIISQKRSSTDLYLWSRSETETPSSRVGGTTYQR